MCVCACVMFDAAAASLSFDAEKEPQAETTPNPLHSPSPTSTVSSTYHEWLYPDQQACKTRRYEIRARTRTPSDLLSRRRCGAGDCRHLAIFFTNCAYFYHVTSSNSIAKSAASVDTKNERRGRRRQGRSSQDLSSKLHHPRWYLNDGCDQRIPSAAGNSSVG